MVAIPGEPLRLNEVSAPYGPNNDNAIGATVAIVEIVGGAQRTYRANATVWENDAGGSITITVDWYTIGTPTTGAANSVVVHARVPGASGDIGATTRTVNTGGTDNGNSSFTFRFDSDPLSVGLGSSRAGMVEIFIEVERTDPVAWGPVDSRGGGTPPIATQLSWSRGYTRAPVTLPSLQLQARRLDTNAFITEPSKFAHGDAIYVNSTLGAQLYRAQAIDIRLDTSVAAPARFQNGTATASTARNAIWNTFAPGLTGRVQSDFLATDDDLDIRYVIDSSPTFGGDAEYVWDSTFANHDQTPSGPTTIGPADLIYGNRAVSNASMTLANVTPERALTNIGRPTTLTYQIQNIRGENYTYFSTPDPTFDSVLKNGAGTTVQSSLNQTANGGTYHDDRTPIEADLSDLEAAYIIGDGEQWSLFVALDSFNGMLAHDPPEVDIYKVSSRLQLNSTSVVGNDRTLSIVAQSAGDGVQSLFNLAEIVRFTGYVFWSNGDPIASQAVTVSFKDGAGRVLASSAYADVAAEESTLSPTTAADGQFVADLTLASGTHAAAFDFTGQRKHLRVEIGSKTDDSISNGAEGDAGAWFVSSKWRFGRDAAGSSANALTLFRLLADSSANGFIDTQALIGTEPALFTWLRGETVNLVGRLRYARGTELKNYSANLEIRNAAGDALDEAQPFTTDAVGQLDVEYEIDADDPTGLKYALATDGSSSTDPTVSQWTVSDTPLMDLHVQLITALNADDFPTEDANEFYGPFVILANLINAWVHLEVPRNDGTEINTIGNAVTVTWKDPDGTVIDTFTLDSGQDPTNGNIDGWTPRFRPTVTAPAGDWTLSASLAYFGNSAGPTAHTLTIASPNTSNKRFIVGLDAPSFPLVGPTVTLRILSRIESQDETLTFQPMDGQAGRPVPDKVPTLKLGHFDRNQTPSWVEDLPETDLLNTELGTADVPAEGAEDAAHYHLDITVPTTEGRYKLVLFQQVEGAPIHMSFDLIVAKSDVYMVAHPHLKQAPLSSVHGGTSWDSVVGDRS